MEANRIHTVQQGRKEDTGSFERHGAVSQTVVVALPRSLRHLRPHVGILVVEHVGKEVREAPRKVDVQERGA